MKIAGGGDFELCVLQINYWSISLAEIKSKLFIAVQKVVDLRPLKAIFVVDTINPSSS